MKKFLFILLALCLVLSLSSCKWPFGKDDEKVNDNSTGEIDILETLPETSAPSNDNGDASEFTPFGDPNDNVGTTVPGGSGGSSGGSTVPGGSGGSSGGSTVPGGSGGSSGSTTPTPPNNPEQDDSGFSTPIIPL